MATLVLGQTLETRENAVLLDPNLRPGDYRAQLVVVGPSGVSEPAEIRIRVLARRLDPIDPRVIDPRVIDPRVEPRLDPRIDPRPVPARPVTPLTPVAPTRSVKPKRKAKPKAKPAVAAKKKAGRSPPQKPKRK